MKSLVVWFLRRLPSRWLLEAMDIRRSRTGVSLVNPKTLVWVARGGIPLLYLDVMAPKHCRATVLLEKNVQHAEFLSTGMLTMAHREYR